MSWTRFCQEILTVLMFGQRCVFVLSWHALGWTESVVNVMWQKWDLSWRRTYNVLIVSSSNGTVWIGFKQSQRKRTEPVTREGITVHTFRWQFFPSSKHCSCHCQRHGPLQSSVWVRTFSASARITSRACIGHTMKSLSDQWSFNTGALTALTWKQLRSFP